MSRASRIPYHQNVYDLLQIEPGESPEAARMIADHEAAHGPLPASVKEWYLVPNVVPLAVPEDQWAGDLLPGTIWFDYSNMEQVPSLEEVLSGFATLPDQPRGRFVQILVENQGVARWWVEVTGGDDPPVWCDNDEPEHPDRWSVESPCVSGFLAWWIAGFYRETFTPISRNSSDARADGAELFVKPHLNGLWLRTPAEPFVPAVIDYLTEQLDEPQRTPRSGNVTTYTFRPAGGTIRVTADEPGLGGALSAWWLHADSPERLAELARLVLPFGTLRDTLRADTDPAREVLRQFTGERPA